MASAPDISSDPGVVTAQAELQPALDEQKVATSRLAADTQNYNPVDEAGPQPVFQGIEPKDHMDDLMKQAPLMMALAAMGGALGHQSGLTMLTSTNAMMKGIVQGNSDAYADARQKFDQQYTEFRDKQKTWIDTYKAYAAAYKGRVDADQLAVRGANAAVGMANAAVKNATTTATTMALLPSRIDQAVAKTRNLNADTVKKGVETAAIDTKVKIAQQNADAKTAQVANQVKTVDANALLGMSRSIKGEAEAITKQYPKQGDRPADVQVKLDSLTTQLDIVNKQLEEHTKVNFNTSKPKYDEARAAIAAGADRAKVIERLVQAGLDPSQL